MEQWEYLTTFMRASARDQAVQQFIRDTFDKRPKRHSPEALIPELNKLGDEGWELIHMEPVPQIGRNEDVNFNTNNWSSTYFCVLKRRKPGSSLPIHVTSRIQHDDNGS